MNSQIVWFLRNTKIFKGIKSLIRRLNNSYYVEISPSSLLLLQHIDGQFNRYDIIVRLLAIENLIDTENGGIKLYNKMQLGRNIHLEINHTAIKAEDYFEVKKGSLENLVSSFQKKGFDQKFPISVNDQFGLVDGSHRLACALYFGIKKITIERNNPQITDYGMAWFQNYFEKRELDQIQSRYLELIAKIDIQEVLRESLTRENQYFGRGDFYQSCEEIGLSGQRPTSNRYDIYNLDKHLKPHHELLDIGCNCGFFTLMAARRVKHAMGIEISSSLVEIGRMVQAYLGVTNVTFQTGSFNKIKLEKKFDFIFSFAVHHWIESDIKKYAFRLHKLLKPRGKVLFESQNIEKQDMDWDLKVKAFLDFGFYELEKGSLKDDHVISRKFSLLEKI